MILIKLETTLYRPRRTGERKRKSARGCICGSDLSVIALKVLIKGEGEVEGLTDAERPRKLGPKRASHIRKAFVLRKNDDVRKYVVRRQYKEKDGKTFYKAPKIQRLITEKRVRRKALNRRSRVDAWKATKEAHVAYEKLLSKYLKEKKPQNQLSDGATMVSTRRPQSSTENAFEMDRGNVDSESDDESCVDDLRDLTGLEQLFNEFFSSINTVEQYREPNVRASNHTYDLALLVLPLMPN